MSHGHGAHGGGDENKKIALLMSVWVLFLAIAETMAKGAQTNSISYNVEASNLWSFYQAKTIRQTVLKTAGEQLEIDAGVARDPAVKQLLDKRIKSWKEDIARYQSEPKPTGGEGRTELAQRAKVSEEKRDLYTAKYHMFEISSAAFQIALVLASSFLITGVVYLLWGSALLGGLGGLFLLVGLFAPTLIHL